MHPYGTYMIHPETQYSKDDPDYIGLVAADADWLTDSDLILKKFGINPQDLEFLWINVSINRGTLTQVRILVSSSKRRKNSKYLEFYIDISLDLELKIEEILSIFSEVNIVVQDSKYVCSSRRKYSTITIWDL